jgi:hypothetical protein
MNVLELPIAVKRKLDLGQAWALARRSGLGFLQNKTQSLTFSFM